LNKTTHESLFFGSTTQKEALDHGLRVDILAPTPATPSMTMALENTLPKLIKENNFLHYT
jgi:uroporphyrinogen-III synthase